MVATRRRARGKNVVQQWYMLIISQQYDASLLMSCLLAADLTDVRLWGWL